jgi:hypothetical protein
MFNSATTSVHIFHKNASHMQLHIAYLAARESTPFLHGFMSVVFLYDPE